MSGPGIMLYFSLIFSDLFTGDGRFLEGLGIAD